jgi:hypothetical protein
MLINKSISSGDIVSLKLINGDELIARFENEHGDEITINRPLALTLSGNGGLGMIPWIILGDKESITLKKSQMFVLMPSKKDAANQYLEGTTGIQIK